VVASIDGLKAKGNLVWQGEESCERRKGPKSEMADKKRDRSKRENRELIGRR
jgi:hypothetical protein